MSKSVHGRSQPLGVRLAWAVAALVLFMLAGCHNVTHRDNDHTVPASDPRQGQAWGAVAQGGSVLGVSTGMRSDLEAQREAIEDCRSKGGRGCDVLSSYYDMCVSVIVSGENTYWAEWYDEEGSRERATSDCQRSGSLGCAVSYSNCTNSQLSDGPK